MKEFGFANGFGKNWPVVIKKCQDKFHRLNVEKTEMNGVLKYSCSKCDYSYKVDSGG